MQKRDVVYCRCMELRYKCCAASLRSYSMSSYGSVDNAIEKQTWGAKMVKEAVWAPTSFLSKWREAECVGVKPSAKTWHHQTSSNNDGKTARKSILTNLSMKQLEKFRFSRGIEIRSKNCDSEAFNQICKCCDAKSSVYLFMLCFFWLFMLALS